MTLPIAAEFARRATQERAQSALPHAPVRRISERPHAPRGRRVIALALRRAADRIEPDARRTGRTADWTTAQAG
jgi:hypothetical protein